jgi:hypothetical protein
MHRLGQVSVCSVQVGGRDHAWADHRLAAAWVVLARNAGFFALLLYQPLLISTIISVFSVEWRIARAMCFTD